MKRGAAILIASVLLASCESPGPKQTASGESTGGESRSSQGTGIWQNDTYTDELGQTSDRDCIRNREDIPGTFTNATARDAPLNVRFLIFNPNSISLQLFENAGNIPVRALSPQSYAVSILDDGGVLHSLKAMNYSDKVAFEKSDARTVHDILMKGGKIRFTLSGDLNTTARYQFTIPNAAGYDAAYRNLSQKQTETPP